LTIVLFCGQEETSQSLKGAIKKYNVYIDEIYDPLGARKKYAITEDRNAKFANS
jgi:hypothetical protein